MKQVEFSVGAKAARLIGRENIADVDGALIELIKNAYDADASCVLVRYDIPFLDVPSKFNVGDFKKILTAEDFNTVISYYEEEKGSIVKTKKLSNEDRAKLEDILTSYNQIIIADNGSGMTYETVTSSWMYIGTSDKESNYISLKGRIKTGAKGIGRFALDKLSRNSIMYTRTESSKKTTFWAMNWDQFANAKLISDVKADIDEIDLSYSDIVYNFFNDVEEKLKGHNWSKGTLIILSPNRDPWNKRLFKKVNSNLKSINPIGSVDTFDVKVINDYCPELDFETERDAIESSNYDYKINLEYDGEETFEIKLQRNEVDYKTTEVVIEKFGEHVVKSVDDFWKRPAFLRENYHKSDYAKEIVYKYQVEKLLPDDSLEKVKKVGKFSAELYFMRLDNNERYPIMKNVIKNKRKELAEKFSGIKIYRDSFKVRPYGDEGALFDWLGLSGRADKSPAGVAHANGAWRVKPYQLIGWVSIGRDNNPLLEDMANREGLALNEYFYIFQELILKGISEFEFDRQYIYREYAKWKKEIEDEIATRHKSDRIIREARRRKEESNTKQYSRENRENENESNAYTEDDFFGTVQQLLEESEQNLNGKQILQILSSSGIILNTFFHEFNAIDTQFHVQAPQIRSRVKYILRNQEYTGIPAYNPYPRLDALEKNDKILAAFIDVVMDGIKKENLNEKDIRLSEELKNIIIRWKLILDEKHVSIEYSSDVEENADEIWRLSKVDLYIIVNNFMLNSVWFLEKTHNPNRKIVCRLSIRDQEFELILKNNGPSLDAKYKHNPNKIFELGETTKVKQMDDEKVVEGTGLGLWIMRETVVRNKGEVEVLDDADGFALRIVINR